MTTYNPSEIEKKWQQKWLADKTYATSKPSAKKGKKYILDMFPYPSGVGLHVGHMLGYTTTDIVARYWRMKGKTVLHPMGWDAFGLPTENYALKSGIHPAKATADNIANFKNQFALLGLSFDWDREINSSHPEYYKWTQWLFLQLYNRGLAYKKSASVNWCPSCETVLADEQVIEGRCERCDTAVVKKDLEQWYFAITKYADRLASDLDHVDWPEPVKVMQRNWIGRKEGMKIMFDDIEVFTTQPDTLAGATFVAIPATDLVSDEKEKVGEFTGKHVTNPLTKKQIPVWRANYVSSEYGSGAIMGVPAYDSRDREFATKYGIDTVEMEPEPEQWQRIEKEGWGGKAINYHLRDWLISRQRYWGAPIPMIHCTDCGWQPVPEDQLPVLLPEDVEFKPTGKSPLAMSKSFQEGVTCPNCKKPAKREVDTMDTFVDSSWYYLRYVDHKNSQKPFSSELVKTWLPVDLYVGGDHTTTHLIYSRFITKVLQDIGIIDFGEPFAKFFKNGHILGEDNRKMSKRWGNVVNPDDVVAKFGADTLRMYEVFMGPVEAMKPWSTAGAEGVYRFLKRVWKLFLTTYSSTGTENSEMERQINLLIKKVSKDIESLDLNTAVSAMMEAFNAVSSLKDNNLPWQNFWARFAKVLAPFAPHLAEEIWFKLQHKTSVHLADWPTYDESLFTQSQTTVVVQINGKVRERLEVEANIAADQTQIEQLALVSDKVKNHLKTTKYRVVFIPGKLVNFVT